MSSKIASLRTDLPDAKIPKPFLTHGGLWPDKALRSLVRKQPESCARLLLFGATTTV
jgi:hypothetical protein